MTQLKTEKIKIADIEMEAGTQTRAKIDTETIGDYADAMAAGANFPPPVVFWSGERYILADGFHRIFAAQLRGHFEIEAEVRSGTKSDALKYALGANTTHGLKRTNADKHRAVELALEEWPRLSDRKLAEICGVHDTLVARIRRSNCCRTAVEDVRIGADGKERRLPRRVLPPRAECRTGSGLQDKDQQPASGEAEEASFEAGATDSPVEEETPHIKTRDEEIADIEQQSGEDSSGHNQINEQHPLPVADQAQLSEKPTLKSQVRYHLDMVLENAKILLERLDNDTIAPGDLEDAANQQSFTAKLLRKLAQALPPESVATN